MAHHPFRFGVNVYGAANRDEWIAKAQNIEALGYDTLFVADHVGTFPPIAGMMAAAAATMTLRIGSMSWRMTFVIRSCLAASSQHSTSSPTAA